ncbi:SRPBCC domain-containing protein [Vulcanisaeta distributa]|uniref:CoxG family protein n=1 Tax=Vulcanisaeta distributa TaxID=164451 RepID=UPI000A80A1E7|nr:SRPBCC domain-containing protein [Vulcanisaeta distributa]
MARVHYDGSFEVNKPRDVVYNFLVDPRNIASIIPGVESVDVVDPPDNFRVKASMGVGAIKGTINITAKFAEKKPPESARVVGRGARACRAPWTSRLASNLRNRAQVGLGLIGTSMETSAA